MLLCAEDGLDWRWDSGGGRRRVVVLGDVERG